MRQIFLLALLFVVTFSANASDGFKVSYSSPNSGAHNLSYSMDDYSLNQIEINGVSYTKLSFDNQISTTLQGWAELPVLSTSLQISSTNDVSVVVISEKYEDISLDFPMLPSRGVIYRDQDPSTVPYTIAPNSIVDRFYPASITNVSTPYIIRDVRGVSVEFMPFQYNAVTNTLRVYTEIEVEVVEQSTSSTNPLINENSQILPEMAGMYASLFVNYDASKYDLNMDDLGDILVITTSRDEAAVAPFVTWKLEKGFNVELEVVSTGTNVKSMIQDAYDSNPSLLYVQLVGDWADIKCDLGGGANAPMDPMLGCVVGTDNFPDISIGRFSASNPAQVTIQVDKAIDYEKTPDIGADWYEAAIGIGSDQGASNGDDGEIDYVHIENIYTERLEPFTYNTNYQNYDPGANASNLGQDVNAGASIINYCGHGAATSFVTTGFSNTNVNALTNGTKLPFIISVACVNGAFHNSSDCFAEAWLRKENGGAVVTWMSTINQPWQPPQRGQDYFNDILVGGYDYSAYPSQNGISTTEQRTHWGSIAVNSSNLMLTEASAGEDIETVQTWTTFGDASLQLRTATPATLTYSNNVLLVGADFETIVSADGAPIAGATVCLSQNGVYASAVSDATGAIAIPNTFTPGDILIVITAFNTSTTYETIQCIPPTGPYVIFDSYVINDDNNQLDYYDTETLLNVSMKNVGVSVASDVDVTITSTDSYITILDGTQNFGDINDGASVNIDDAFKIQVAGDVPEGHAISFVVTAVGTETWESGFTIIAHSADLKYVGFVIDDASGNQNGSLDPGEVGTMTIEILNDGSADAFNVNGLLQGLDAYVTVVTTEPQAFGNIVGAATATANFTVMAADDVPAGEISNLELNFTADYGFAGTTQLEISFADYCQPEGNCSMSDGIDGFALEDIDNLNNGCSTNGYGDFRDMSTELAQGSTYQATVQTAYSSQMVSIWIDFNADKEFTADEMLVDDYSASATGNHSIDLDIPADAPNGQRCMRVRAVWNNSASSPCEDVSYGETEDYTVVLNNGITLPAPTGLTGSCTSSDEVTINWNAPAGGAPLGYNVYRGSALVGDALTATTFVENDVPAGDLIYMVKAIYDEGESAPAGPLVINVTYPVPTNLVAAATGSDVDLTWDAVESKDLLGYNLFRDGTQVNTDPIVGLEYNETLAVSDTYCYTVAALFTAGQGASCEEVCVDITVGVGSLESQNVAIYPNPVSDRLSIESGVDITRVSIYNVAGQIVLNQMVEATTCTLNTESLESGVYFIQLLVGDKTITEKLIVR